ncbi:BID domain-containing T4SS effector [Bartonella sp. B41]
MKQEANDGGVLIPAEQVNPLAKEEVAAMLREDVCVQFTKEQVCKLSGIVYGNPNKLNKQLEKALIDPGFGDRFSGQIGRYPTSVSSFAGIDVFFVKSQSRVEAENSAHLLGAAFSKYMTAIRQSKGEIHKEHQEAQQRKSKSVKMPSQELRNLFSLSKEEQKEILLQNPSMQKELGSLITSLNSRLSVEEKRAVNNRDHEQLATSIGVSGEKAKEISNIICCAKEVHRLSQDLVRRRPVALAMAS